MRTITLTQKVKTAFGSMYIHVELDAAFQPVGGSISDPGKEPQSQIARLVEDLSRGLDDLLKTGGRAAGKRNGVSRELFDPRSRDRPLDI